MNKKNILIIAIIVVVLLLGYFFILNPNKTTDMPEEEVTTEEGVEGDVLGDSTVEDINLDPQLVVYSNTEHGFSFVYPDALFDLEVTDDGARLNHHEVAFDFVASEGEALNENEIQLHGGNMLTMTADHASVEKLPENIRLELFNQIYLTIAAQ